MLIVICGSWLLNVLLYSMKGNADEWWEKLGSTVPCLLFFLVVIIIKKVLPVALVFSKNCQISANALEVCVHESYWCRRWWQKRTINERHHAIVTIRHISRSSIIMALHRCFDNFTSKDHKWLDMTKCLNSRSLCHGPWPMDNQWKHDNIKQHSSWYQNNFDGNI